MQVQSVVTVKVTLELNEEEARWLKITMQNPLHGDDPSTESILDSQMRRLFFNAISLPI